MRPKRRAKRLHAAAVAAVDPKSRPDALAAWLVAIVLLRDVGWARFPPEFQGMASKGLGALLVLFLLGALWTHAQRSRWLLAGIAYGAWSALQTAICSAAYMLQPWEVPPGIGICSARVEFDLGALGLMFAAWFAVRASRVSSYR